MYRYRGYTPVPFLAVAVLFSEPTIMSISAGVGMVILGELIRVWAVRAAGYETRSTLLLTARKLVTNGPFAYVRNPLYLANLLIYAGIAIMSMALFPWLLVGAFLWFLAQYYLLAGYEEEFLEARFGESYGKYKASVNRFIPGLPNRANREDQGLQLAVQSALKAERRTIQAEVLVTCLLFAIYLIRQG